MNREDIIRMAREARLTLRGHYDESGSTPQELERFAALVAALAQQAEPVDGACLHGVDDGACKECYAANAEPVEPVAWLYRDSWGTMKLSQVMPPPVGAFPVYTTTPPQRKPLTEEKPWRCACGANLYIDENGAPRSRA